MTSFEIHCLEYHQALREDYALLADCPGFVLLESSDGDLGRYDILSAYPYQQLTIESDCLDIDAQLNAFKDLLPQIDSTLDLPFQGGAIGYVSYDLGERLSGIYSEPQPNLALLPLLNFGFYDWAIISDHLLKKTCLFAAHRQAETASIVTEVLALWKKKSKEKRYFRLVSEFKPLMSQAHYEKGYESIHKDIVSGRSYQVNFTQPFVAGYEGSSWAIYEQLSSQNPVPFGGYLAMDEGAVISCSPERYLLMDKGELLASPIKGTVRRSSDVEEDLLFQQQLLACPKNRAENVMIVDLMRHDLGQIAKPGTVCVTALCTLQSFRGVHHLVSDIRAHCKASLHPLDAFMSCFPGGSITGAPKLEAMRIINEQEIYARGVYCGALVYFSAHGRFDSSIAIRTLTAKHQHLHLSAGGGVVIDSKVADEYQECFTKVSAIIQALDTLSLSVC